MHIPVLEKEVLEYLDPKPNENFIDCTIGEGSYALAILERNGPEGKVLGIEWDPELYKKLKKECLRWNLKQRLVLVNDSYINLKSIVEKYNFKAVKGILFDLGLSSWHLEESKRGFSFLRDEPLIMRYDGDLSKLTGEKILNEWSEKDIKKILREYGEERFAKKIAKEIVEERLQPTHLPPAQGGPLLKPIKTTFQLIEIIKKATPSWYQRKRIHPATKTFQALRIVVNDELNNLKKALPQASEVLGKKGRLVVISFHSLEDKIVKTFFKNYTGPTRVNLRILTKKPIIPSKEEIKINPRSRSAKLRAALKL